MKLIIAGSRDFHDHVLLDSCVRKLEQKLNRDVTEIVSGCARGADLCGEAFANRFDIPIKRFPANWKEHGKAAGAIRNTEMAEYGDAACVFRVNESRGSSDMIKKAERFGLPHMVVDISVKITTSLSKAQMELF